MERNPSTSSSQSRPQLEYDRPWPRFGAALELDEAGHREDAMVELNNLIFESHNLLPILYALVHTLLVLWNSETNADIGLIHFLVRACLEFKEEQLLDGISGEEQQTLEFQNRYKAARDGLDSIRKEWQGEAEAEQAIQNGQQSLAPASTIGESSTASQTSIARTDSRELKCDFMTLDGPCNKPFRGKDRYRRIEYHMNIHNGLKPYVCGVEGCDKAYPSRTSLWCHRSLKAHWPREET